MDAILKYYTLALYSSAVLSLMLALILAGRRKMNGTWAAFSLFLLMGVIFAGSAIQVNGLVEGERFLLYQFIFLTEAVIPTVWLVFVLLYTGMDSWLSRIGIATLLTAPLAIAIAMVTNSRHGWLWTELRLDDHGFVIQVLPELNTGFWIICAFILFMLLLTAAVLLNAAISRRTAPRGHLLLILISACLPYGVFAASLFSLIPNPGLDLVALTFSVSVLINAWTLRGIWLFDIVPVARNIILDEMNSGVLILDGHNRVLDANQDASQFLGKPLKHILGRRVDQVFPLLAGLIKSELGSWSGSQAPQEELREEISVGEGEGLRYYDLSVSTLWDRFGSLHGRLVVWRDITERRQAEEAVRERETRLRMVVNQLPAILWTTDAQLRFTSAMGAGLIDLERTAEQMMGESIERVGLQGSPTAAAIVAHHRAMNGQPSPYQEMRNGRLYQCYVEPLKNSLGDIIGTVGLGIDMTEQQLVERALADSEERYRQSVEQSPNPIFSVTHDGRILAWNLACERVFKEGVNALGRSYHAFLANEEQAASLDELIQAVFDDRAYFTDVEVAFKTQTGNNLYMLSRLFPITLADGKVISCVLANTDISERIKAEQTLRRQLEELSVLNAVGSACVEAISEDELYERVTEIIGRSLYPQNFGILLVDESAQSLHFHRSYRGLPESLKEASFPLNEGICGEVVASGLPVRVSDISRSSNYLHLHFPSLSELCVPIKIDNQVMLVINAESHTLDAFSDADERLLITIAGQIATAVERLRAEAAEKRRVEELLTITRVSSEITSVLDRQALFQSIVRNAAELSASDACGLFLLRPDGRFYLVAAYGVGEAFTEQIKREGVPVSGTAVGRAFSSMRPVQIPNVSEDHDYSTRALAEMEGIQSILAIPLMLSKEPIGGIVLWRRIVHESSPEEIVFIQALAQQSVNALENARLFDAERSQRELAEVMREVATTLTASLDLETVLDHLLDQIALVVPYNLGNILVVDHGFAYSARYKGDAQFTLLLERVLPRLHLSVGSGSLQLLQSSGQPLIIPDLQSAGMEDIRLGSPALRAWIGAPIVIRGRMVAVFSLYACEPDYYSEVHAQRLASLAGQAALALQNARLFQETHQRASHLEAINAVITGAPGAKDLRSLLELSLRAILHALSLSSGGIRIGEQIVIQELSEAAIPVEWNIPEHRNRPSRPFCVEDWSLPDIPDTVPQHQMLRKLGVGASIAIPIAQEDRVVGGMLLASSQPRRWSMEERSLVEAIARQLGTASERLVLMEETQAQARQVQQIMDTVPDGVVLLDAEQKVAMANPAAIQYLDLLASGYKDGRPLDRLAGIPVPDLLRQPVERPWHELETPAPYRRIFEIAARPLESRMQPEGWVLILRDVTQERENQERIQMQERLATVGQLAAGIAHDFNNIMAAIMVYTDLLTMEARLSPAGQDRLDTIQQQVQRATSLIRQILDFSRRSIMEQSEMDLLPFIKELDKLLGRVLPENIRLELNYQPGIYLAKADPTRLQQVFMNLALNARDAMPRGGNLSFNLSRFSLRAEDTLPFPDLMPGEWIRVEVRDTGEGISADILPHIFDPFFTTKPVGQGTGLGLAQVYGIIKAHHGSIDVRSHKHGGTSFIIYLPALPVRRLEDEPGEVYIEQDGNGETVLLVEDDRPAREALEAMLASQNYRVLSAQDGLQALQIFLEHTNQIALVISDLVMPEMGGLALYDALRESEPDVRVLFITGHPMLEESQELLEGGMVKWLQKPFTMKEFTRAIRGLLLEKA